MLNKPTVSVCMITYNHEKYIAEAIEGVLMQEVDFEVELIIADDASTDTTGEIVQSYIDTHSRGSWIKYTRHPVNKGMMGNFVWALEQCQGEYIALCDGDDYWIDNEKLSRQVGHLKSNPNVVLSFHPVNVLYPDGKLDYTNHVKKNIDVQYGGLLDLVLYGNFIHTPSVLFKKKFDFIPEYFHSLEVGDFFLYLFVCRKSCFAKLDFVGANYRYGVGYFSRESIVSIKQKFKRSLLIASQNQTDLKVRLMLFLRVYQDNLYSRNKIIVKGISPQNSFSIFREISLFQITKSIIKWLFNIESYKL